MTHPPDRPHLLDRPIWSALSTLQRAHALENGAALAFDPSISAFAGTADDTPASLADLQGLIPPGGYLALFTRDELTVPPPLLCRRRATLQQMQMTSPIPAETPLPTGTRALTMADAGQALQLVARTKPGPFAANTLRLGRFLGVFVEDRLVCMAGERLHLPGHVEISAVCTDAGHRGRGWAAQLTQRLCADALARGETPILHVFADNAAAHALYCRLGFTDRAEFHLAVLGTGQPHG